MSPDCHLCPTACYYHCTPFWHFFKDIFFVTRPYCGELRYFHNKGCINTGAIWNAYLKEIGECTFAGEGRTTFWQNCGGCHGIITTDAINFHLSVKWNHPIFSITNKCKVTIVMPLDSGFSVVLWCPLIPPVIYWRKHIYLWISYSHLLRVPWRHWSAQH